MLQMTVSGVSLQEKMEVNQSEREPVVSLGQCFIIDDTVLEKPTLLIGQVGSGKSWLLRHSLMPQIFSKMAPGDAAVVFATKRELIEGFCHPEKGDILIDYEAVDPDNIWNIFEEMRASSDAERTLTELCDVMFSKHKNTMQPFFSTAAKDMFKSMTMYIFKNYEKQTGKKPSHSTLMGFFHTLTLQDITVGGRIQKGMLTLIKEVPELHHLADYIGNGQTPQALGVLGELRSVINEVFQGGAFVRSGNFSARGALKEGRKIFLLYNFAESTESNLLFFDMIVDQLIKRSLYENCQKVWFVLDEFSILGHLQYLEQAMAFGRGNGFRMLAAIQSVQLMEKNYTREEAECMLGLFPNVFCFFTSDHKSRELVSNRYGNSLVSVAGIGNGRSELMERKAVQDADFYKIVKPGDCIVSLAGYVPFIFQNHRNAGDTTVWQ